MRNSLAPHALLVPFALLAMASMAHAQDPEALVNAAQSAADELRASAGADLAFVTPGLFKDKSRVSATDLASNLLFPTDEVVVLTLTGAQLKAAFERSLSFYPQPSASFLYLSGGTVTFNPKAAAGARVTSVSTDSGAFSDSRTYKVAMASSLGNGGFGYFKVWNSNDITSKSGSTMESVLKDKRALAGPLRWLSRG